MKRKNCWEVLECGREQGGEKEEELGVCPAAEHSQFDNVNKGKYSGRFCWVVAGTFCEDKVSGTHAQKLLDCIECEFFKQVSLDEGREFVISPKRGKE